MNEILAAITVLLAIICSRPFTTFVHELGHALPALAFTRREVIIYVGSYGDLKRSTHFKIGRLIIFFTPRITELQLGLCQHKAPKTIGQSMAIVFGGPLFSLLLGLTCAYLILQYKEQPYIAFALAIFLTSGVLDFLINIIPTKEPMYLHDGSISYNDGYQFMQLIKTSNYPPVYFEALDSINKEEYDKATEQFYEAAETGIMSGPLYQEAINFFSWPQHEGRYLGRAIDFHERYHHHFKLDGNDFFVIGELYETFMGDELKAISNYSKSIEINYLNPDALLARAKLFNKLGYEMKAIADLKKVVSMDESSVEAREMLASLLN